MQEFDLHTETPMAVAERERVDAPAPSPSSMIVFENVSKIYPPNVAALRHVTFVVEKGEFVFVVGPSGSGKSTIVRLLLKELEPTGGRIIVGGRDLGRLRRSRTCRACAATSAASSRTSSS